MATLYDMMGDRPFGDDPIRTTLWEPASLKYGRNPLRWTRPIPGQGLNGGWSESQLALDPFSAAGLGTGQGGIGWYPDQPWDIPPFSIFSASDNQRLNPDAVRPGEWSEWNLDKAFGEPNYDGMYRKDMLSQLLGPHKAGDVILSDQERQMMQDKYSKEVMGNIRARQDAIRPAVDASNNFKQRYDQTLQTAKDAVRNAATEYDPRLAETIAKFDTLDVHDKERVGGNPIDALFPSASNVQTGYAIAGDGSDVWDENALDMFYRSTDPVARNEYNLSDKFGADFRPSPTGYLNYLQGKGFDASGAQNAVNDLTNLMRENGEMRGAVRADGTPGENLNYVNFMPQGYGQYGLPPMQSFQDQFNTINQQQQNNSVINQQAYDSLVNKGQDGGTIPKDFSRPFYGQITGTQGWGSQGDGWNSNAAWGMPNSQGMTYNPNGPGTGLGWGSTGFGQQQQRQNSPTGAWGGVFANQNPWGLS
tara:strand:+ start:455 stop:1882 length:1428 start_codon:yes stop_codon:yes gene_type:complete